jgi:SnoaL-like polyketide cyclase
LAAAWLEAWEPGGDFGVCCSADVQYEDPLAADPLTGPSALADHRERIRTAVPDLRIERSAMTLSGGAYICVPWRAAGTHRETNRFLAVHGLHYLETSSGTIKRARGFFDLYNAATQLGLLPGRGSITEQLLLLLRGFGLRPT